MLASTKPFGINTPGSTSHNPYAGGVPNSVYAANSTTHSSPGYGPQGGRQTFVPSRGGSGSGGSVWSQVGGKPGAVPKPNFQVPQSNIPAQSLMDRYRPWDVMRRSLNSQVAQLHQQADPYSAFQNAGASADNMSSAGGASKVAHIQQQMAQPLAQANMLQATYPLQWALDNYNFNSGVMGTQAQGILDREGIMDQHYQGQLSDYLSNLGNTVSLASLLMG